MASLPSWADIFNSSTENNNNDNSFLNTGTGSTLIPPPSFNANEIDWKAAPTDSPPLSLPNMSFQTEHMAPLSPIDSSAPPLGEDLALQAPSLHSNTSPTSLSKTSSPANSEIFSILKNIMSGGDKSNITNALELRNKGAANTVMPPDTNSLPTSLLSFVKDENGKTIVLFKGKPITGSGASMRRGA